jgi:hypothetical protein
MLPAVDAEADSTRQAERGCGPDGLGGRRPIGAISRRTIGHRHILSARGVPVKPGVFGQPCAPFWRRACVYVPRGTRPVGRRSEGAIPIHGMQWNTAGEVSPAAHQTSWPGTGLVGLPVVDVPRGNRDETLCTVDGAGCEPTARSTWDTGGRGVASNSRARAAAPPAPWPACFTWNTRPTDAWRARVDYGFDCSTWNNPGRGCVRAPCGQETGGECHVKGDEADGA